MILNEIMSKVESYRKSVHHDTASPANTASTSVLSRYARRGRVRGRERGA